MTYPGRGWLLRDANHLSGTYAGVAGEFTPVGDRPRMVFAEPVAGLTNEQQPDFMVGAACFAAFG